MQSPLIFSGMDPTATLPAEVQDTTEHRPSRSLRIASSSSHPSLAPRPQPKEERVSQRCYYAIFIVLFLVALLTNLVSFVLFMIVDIQVKGKEVRYNNESFFATCVLFVGKGKDMHTGAWSCDVVLVAKSVVLIVTLLVFILYLILIVKGTKM